MNIAYARGSGRSVHTAVGYIRKFRRVKYPLRNPKERTPPGKAGNNWALFFFFCQTRLEKNTKQQ